MPSAHIEYASPLRRMTAAAIDVFVLLSMITVVLLTVLDRNTADSVFAQCLGVAYVAWQAATLLHPRLSVGRTVAGVLVVAASTAGPLRGWQVLARPVTAAGLALLSVVLLMHTEHEELAWLPLLLEVGLLIWSPGHRTLRDRVAGTMVLRMPPLQPHRAPAVPMFSRTDEEFGPKP